MRRGIAIGLVLAAASVVALVFSIPRSEAPLSLTFLGFTTNRMNLWDTNRYTLARFRLTNTSQRKIIYEAEPDPMAPSPFSHPYVPAYCLFTRTERGWVEAGGNVPGGMPWDGEVIGPQSTVEFSVGLSDSLVCSFDPTNDAAPYDLDLLRGAQFPNANPKPGWGGPVYRFMNLAAFDPGRDFRVSIHYCPHWRDLVRRYVNHLPESVANMIRPDEYSEAAICVPALVQPKTGKPDEKSR